MILELFFYCIWANLWFGFTHYIQKYSSTYRNYPINVKNNIISLVHSLLSVHFAGRYLTETKHYANVFLYEQAVSNTSLTNISNLNESLTSGGYNYVNMLEVYNYVADPWSFTLLSLQAMSVCYFVADCIYIISEGLIYRKAPYIFHHVMIILLHYYAYTSENTYEYVNMFYYGELSNFFTYTTYHFIKTKNEHMAYASSLFQCVWFTVFRVLVYSYFMIYYVIFSSVDSIFMKLFCPVIYVMGLMWGYNLWKTTYESIEKRGHFDLIKNEFYNTRTYFMNTIGELQQFMNILMKISNNKPSKDTSNEEEVTHEVTHEVTQEVTQEVTHESTEELSGEITEEVLQETIQEVTEDMVEKAIESVDEVIEDTVGTFTYDPLKDNRSYTLRRRATVNVE